MLESPEASEVKHWQLAGQHHLHSLPLKDGVQGQGRALLPAPETVVQRWVVMEIMVEQNVCVSGQLRARGSPGLSQTMTSF